jgi:glycosyltransferase involved in cell wall biosynthesis
VDHNDIDGYAVKLLMIIEDSELSISFSKKARENIVKYHPESITKIWCDLFFSLINLK